MAESAFVSGQRRAWVGVLVFLGSLCTLVAIISVIEKAMMPANAITITELRTKSAEGEAEIPFHSGRYHVRADDEFRSDLIFELPDGDPRWEETALLVLVARRQVTMRYCGEELAGGVRDTPSRYKSFEPHFFSLPNERCDRNVIEMTVDGVRESPALRTIYFGEATEITQSYRWRKFFAVDFIMIATGVAAVSALLAFAALSLAGKRMLFLTFGSMMAIWALRNVYYVGPLSEKSERFVDIWFYSFTYCLLAVSALFVNEWTFKNRFVLKAILFPVILTLCAVALVFAFGHGAHASLVVGIGYAVAGACIVVMVTQHIVALWRLKTIPVFESYVFLIGACAGLMDLAGQNFPNLSVALFGGSGQTIPISPLMPTLTAIAITLFLAREGWRAQRLLESSNRDLELRLHVREEEVRTAYAEREEKALEASMLRERQRIMEDIHDGFGNRLLALSLQVKREHLDRENLSKGIEDSLRDLRLIVDSMDTADGDLALSLGALKGRLEPDLRAADIDLDWSVILDDTGQNLRPRAMLSIYRIIQEATTNVIRHSDAENFLIGIALQDGTLSIALADNGRGLERDQPRGRGIKNIRNRAVALQGTAIFESDGGLKITISIPVQAITVA